MDGIGHGDATLIAPTTSAPEGESSAEQARGLQALQPVSHISAGLATRAATTFGDGMPPGHAIVGAFLPATQVPVEGPRRSTTALQVPVEGVPDQRAGLDSLQVPVEGVQRGMVAPWESSPRRSTMATLSRMQTGQRLTFELAQEVACAGRPTGEDWRQFPALHGKCWCCLHCNKVMYKISEAKCIECGATMGELDGSPI